MTFRAVYEEQFAYVYRALRGLGVPETDVLDAVQEVFLVVHRRLAEFEGRSKITTWLFEIALRVAKHRRTAFAKRREELVSEVELSGEPDRNFELREQSMELDRILAELPLYQREVFVMYELAELEGEEIAELLSIPIGTVRSRLRLARGSFQRALHRRSLRERFELACPEGTCT